MRPIDRSDTDSYDNAGRIVRIKNRTTSATPTEFSVYEYEYDENVELAGDDEVGDIGGEEEEGGEEGEVEAEDISGSGQAEEVPVDE